MSWLTDLFERHNAAARVVSSPLVPEGTMYLLPEPALYDGPMTFREDLWGDAPPPKALLSKEAALMRPVYERERRRGLDFLERELDRMCADVGLDPEAAWREPRRKQTADELWANNRRAFVFETYAAMSILDPATPSRSPESKKEPR